MPQDIEKKTSVAVVVSNNKTRLEAISCMLRRADMILQPFMRAGEALDKMIGEEPPSIIITDLNMPGIDGRIFCRLLRSRDFEPFNRIPILVISDTFTEDKTMDIPEANAILSFPVEDSFFIEKVKSLLTDGERAQIKIFPVVEKFYRIMADSLSEAIHIVDPDLCIIIINKRFREWCEQLGIGADATGRPLGEIFHFLSEEVFRQYRHVIETGCPLTTQEKTEINGQTIFTETQKIPLMDNKKVIAVITIVSDITVQKRTDEALIEQTEVLTERIKELNCLYSLSHLIQSPGISLEEILEESVRLLPSAWRYPDITCVRLTIEGREYRTENYEDTEWKLYQDVLVSGIKAGSIEICYLAEKPRKYEVPFLKEEIDLLKAIAEILQHVIEHKRADKELKAAYIKLESLWNVSSMAGTNIKTISNHILASIVRMTGSDYGFYGFINEDESLMTIHSWSGEAMKDCSMTDKPLHFLISEAGVWAEAVRRREPLVLNNYAASHPAKKGLPEGHVPLTNLLVVPFFSKGRIRAVAAVANRPLSYKEDDISQITSFLNGIQAIVEQKRTEEALKESELRYRTVAEFTYDWEYWIDGQGNFIYCSPSCEVITGYRPEEFEKNPRLLVDIIHPEDRKMVTHIRNDIAISHHEAHEKEFRIFTKSGQVKWIGHLCRIITGDRGEYLGRRGSNRDITDRREAEEALRKSEELLNTTQHLTGVGGWEWDVEKQIMTWSREVYHIHDMEPDDFAPGSKEYIDRSLECYTPEARSIIQEAFGKCVEEGKGYDLKLPFVTAKGRHLWVRTTAIPVMEQGRVLRVTGNIMDITERKEAEEALKESEKRVRAKLDSILLPEGDMGLLELSDIIDVTAVQKLMDEFFAITNFGSAIVDLKGKVLVATGWQDICTKFHRIHPETCKNCRESDTFLSSGVEPGTFKLYRCKNNMWDMATPIMVGGKHLGNMFLGQFFFEDEVPDYETFRLQAKKYGFPEKDYLDALEHVPRWSREIVNHVMTFYSFFANLISTLSYSNIKLAQTLTERERAEEALRKKTEELDLYFNSALDLFCIADTDGYFRKLNLQWEELLGYSLEELTDRRFLDLVHPDDLQAALETVSKLASQIQILNFVNRYRCKDGTYRWIEWRSRPQGKLIYAAARDITEKKLAEEEEQKLRSQLAQAQKLESVGRLAGGVAHDFNNMLGVILGHVELILEDLSKSHPAYSSLREIQEAALRSADLTRQLLAFARKQTVTPKVLDMNDTVSAILSMLRRLIGENIDLAWIPGKDLWPVRIDPAQIDQLLANLCVNARDSITATGKITIETEKITFDNEYCATHPEFIPGSYVMLSVSDDGCGMDKEIVEHIFEPFFTTKGVGEGTGLGLATVYGIVRQNEGFINVYSEPGDGTTFKIYFPKFVEKGVEVVISKAPDLPRSTGETVLLVEDEPLILEVSQIMLKKLGYRVLAAGTPVEALTLAREHTGKIHLLITDVIMPEMNGRELARKLLSLYPGLKRLFMSGYTANVIAHHGVLEEGVNFIQKPFSKQELAEGVRKALESN